MIRYKIVCLIISQLIYWNMHGQNKALKIGVVGLTHTHVHWIFSSDSDNAWYSRHGRKALGSQLGTCQKNEAVS